MFRAENEVGPFCDEFLCFSVPHLQFPWTNVQMHR